MLHAEFYLLGTFAVKVNGTDVPHFPTDKIRAILAYLALEPDRLHRREQLAGFFWPDVPQESALKNLRQSLYRLRQRLDAIATGAADALLHITPQTVALRRAESRVEVDVQQLQAALVTCERHPHPDLARCDECLAQLRQAVELYRGELLAGFSLEDAPDFEEWLRLRRETLYQQVLLALNHLAQAHETNGGYEEAHRYASRQLTLDPYREETHRQLIRLLAKRGMVHQALAQYESCRRILREELGAEPEAETVALVEQIYSGAFSRQTIQATDAQSLPTSEETAHQQAMVATRQPAATSLAAPPNLPALATKLVGREQEQSAIAQHLMDTHCRLLTLVGPGGVGKTSLAIQTAINLQAHFADGVYFVDLTPILDPNLVPLTLAQALGIQDNSLVSLITRLKEVLRDKQMLLVIDNFEQVIKAAPQLAELLAYCPKLKMMITSRRVLHLHAEQVFPVEPLPLPSLQALSDLDALAEVPAVAFFLQRAKAVQPNFRLTSTTAHAIAELCIDLEGLPLAIELVAARLRLLSPQALLTRLRTMAGARLNLLTTGAQDRPEHQQTMQRTIAWSYHLLDPHLKTLFTRLAIFVNGCTVEAAEAICGDGDLPLAYGNNRGNERGNDDGKGGGEWGGNGNGASRPNSGSSTSLDALVELMDQSLLHQQIGVDGEPRLLMLETIREFALEQLVASGEREQLQRRHAAYYLALAEASGLLHERADMLARLQRLEAEHGNLRAALTWSLETKQTPEETLRLAEVLATFWYYRGYWHEGRQWLEQALATIPATSRTPQRAQVSLHLAEIAFGQGDFGVARTYLEESLAHFRRLDDRIGIASTLSVLGLVVREQGDAARARETIEECLARFQEEGAEQSIPWVMCSLGEVLVMQGDAQQAKRVLEESLAIFRSQGEQLGIGWAYNHLGHVAQFEQDYQQALTLHEASLPHFRDRDRNGTAWAMCSLGQIAHAQNRLGASLAHYIESMQLFRELGSRQGVAWCLAGIAEVANSAEAFEQAAWMWGAVETLRARGRGRPAPGSACDEAQALAALRAQLGQRRFEQAWRAGSTASLEEVLTRVQQLGSHVNQPR